MSDLNDWESFNKPDDNIRNSLGQFTRGWIPWNKQEPIYKTCEKCGIIFKIKPCMKGRTRFCSNNCYGQSLKGKPSWNKGLSKYTDERVKRLSLNLKPGGKVSKHKSSTIEKMSEKRRFWHKTHHFFHTEETKHKISLALKGKHTNRGHPQTQETREKISLAMRGRTINWKDKIQDSTKNHWNNLSTEQRSQRVKNVFRAVSRRPTSLEQKLIRIIKENAFPFKYVGDGTIIINGKSPDFIFGNHIIEVYGRHWHQQDNPLDRVKEFAADGYRALIFWEEDLEKPQKVARLINKFIAKGVSLDN